MILTLTLKIKKTGKNVKHFSKYLLCQYECTSIKYYFIIIFLNTHLILNYIDIRMLKHVIKNEWL